MVIYTLATAMALAGQCEVITTVQSVDVLPGMEVDARQYYEKGWTAARRIAVDRGVIAGYELLVARPSSEDTEIVLITRYRDKQQFNDREKNFASIFEAMGFEGPLTVNGKGRSAMIGSDYGAEQLTQVFSSTGDCGLPGHPPAR